MNNKPKHIEGNTVQSNLKYFFINYRWGHLKQLCKNELNLAPGTKLQVTTLGSTG
jgi:hypothetical protein